jgi:hypothetical protein
MIVVTGADIVFSRLPAESAGRSRSLADGVRRKSSLACEQLAEVGGNFISS